MRQVCTVTLNAAVDKTYMIPGMRNGKLHRISEFVADAGGKGINVARVLHVLGVPVAATGFTAGTNGLWIERQLEEEGIPGCFVRVPGESRLCLTIIDPQHAGQATELLEPGPVVDQQALSELQHTVCRLARQSRLVCLSGSLPRGAPADFYATLIAAARAEGAKVWLDASGEALRHGVAAKPDAIKPNEAEARELFGCTDTVDDLCFAAERFAAETGIPNIFVSLGEHGALARMGERTYRVQLPRISAINTVGCGDAFVAGLAAGEGAGLTETQMLSQAAACGMANALQARAGFVVLKDVLRLAAMVKVI